MIQVLISERLTPIFSAQFLSCAFTFPAEVSSVNAMDLVVRPAIHNRNISRSRFGNLARPGKEKPHC